LPRAAYWQIIEGDPTYHLRLKFAWYDGSSWNYATVDDIEFEPEFPIWPFPYEPLDVSLAVDSDGEPGIAYAYWYMWSDPYRGGCFEANVKYAYPTSSAWSSWHCDDVNLEVPMIDQGLMVNDASVSCAFNSEDEPGIAMVIMEYPTNATLRYASAEWTGSGFTWSMEDDPMDTWPNLPVPHCVSLAMDLDATHEPRIAYQRTVSQWSGALKYAYQDSQGWQFDTVTTGFYYAWLALDPENYNPRIAFGGQSSTIKYTKNDGAGWTTPQLVAGSTEDGYPICVFPSLAIDPNTRWPKIVYLHRYSSSSAAPVGACWDGSQWQTMEGDDYDISNAGGAGCWSTLTPKMALDPTSGMPSVFVTRVEDELASFGVAHQLFGGIVQSWYRVADNDGYNLVLFGSGGDIVITRGGLHTYPTAVPTPSGGIEEFIVKKSTGSAPHEVALIKSDTTGDMYIKGDVTEQVSSPSPSDPAMIVKNSSGNIQSFIDENGDMDLRWDVYVNGSPY
jgi:hypothetical protein